MTKVHVNQMTSNCGGGFEKSEDNMHDFEVTILGHFSGGYNYMPPYLAALSDVSQACIAFCSELVP